MMQLKGSSGKNPLVQRVQRYTTMSAIFRSPETTAVLRQPENEASGPVVNTFIIPPAAPEPREMTMPPSWQETMASQSAPASSAAAAPHSSVPVSQAAPLPSLPSENQPAPPKSAFSSDPASPLDRPFSPAQPPPPEKLPTADQPAQVNYAPAPVQRTAVSSPSQANNWSRLKSAARRVQRAVAGSSETAGSAPAAAAPIPAPVEKERTADPTTAVPLPPAPSTITAPSRQEPVALSSQTPRLALIPIQEKAPAAPNAWPTITAASSTFSSPGVSQPANPPHVQRDSGAPQPEADPIERRLDQIMRLHRQKGTIETTPDEKTTPEETAVPSAAPLVQRSSAETASPAASPTTEVSTADPDSRRLDQIMRLHRQKGTIESPPALAAPLPASALQREEIETAIRNSETAVKQTKISDSASLEPEVSREALVLGETLESAGPPPPAEAQAIPLQAAWPVQMIGTPPPVSRPAPVPAASLMRQTAPPGTAKVQQQLESVPPGQPTTSSVQFVQPRKPRPQPAAARPQPLQRQPASDHNRAETKTAVTPSDFITPYDTVPTEIGELPGDLWRLIGAKPPARPTPQPFSPPVLEIENIENSEPGLAAPRSQPDAAQPAIIQRVEAAPQPAEDMAPAAEAPPAPESQQSEAGQRADVDVDELARQVYGVIKDRMTVEWERTRGRF